MWEAIIEFFDTNQGSCMWVSTIGMECPGCGIQRAWVLLLKGQVWESIKMYPALMPMLGLFIFTILHLIYKFKMGADILKYSFIGTTAIIVISFIIKQFTHLH